MSNEFVMVPRAELVRLQENMDPHRGAVAWGIVCDLLEKPHQDEPVAHQIRDYLATAAARENIELATDRDIYKAEVDRLQSVVESLRDQAEELRAQLAERDALLREMHDSPYHYIRDFKPRIDAALSARADKFVPVAPDQPNQ